MTPEDKKQLDAHIKAIAAPADQAPNAPQLAELRSVTEELRVALEQLRSTQAELQQRNQELQAVRAELEQHVADRTAELSQREAFLSSIYDGAAQSIFMVGVTETNDFRYVSFNHFAQQSTGLSLQDVQNKTPEEVFGLETGSRFRQNYERCLQADHSIVYEDHFIFHDRPIWTLTTLSPLRNARGRIDRIVGTVLDISERKQTEVALRESEALHRTLFDSINEGVCLFERLPVRPDGLRDYRYLAMNPTMQSMFGIPDLSGQSIRDNFPDEVEDWYDDYDRVLETGEAIRFERESAPQGIVLEMFVTRVEDESGRRLLAVMQNVTDRKRREANIAFLADISETCSRLSSIEEIVQAVGAKVGDYLHVVACNFCEIDEVRDRVIYFGRWQAAGEPPLPDNICLSEQVSEEFCRRARAGETIVSNNTQTNSVTQAEANASIGALSFITVPFHENGNWKYLFSIHDNVPRTWQDDEIALVQELANRLFPRLERARAEAVVAADLRDTQLLHNMSTRLTTETEIQVLYDEILATAIALMHADAGTVQILDPTGQELMLLASEGFDRSMTDYFHHVSASCHTSCGIALSRGDRTFVDFDVPEGEDPDGSYQMHVNAGYLSAQSTPLLTRSGKFLGMVSTHWRKHHRPSDRELRFLDLLARQAADLLEHRQAEAVLHENEQLLRLAMAGAQAGSWDWILATSQLTWSSETYRLHGLDPTTPPPEYEHWYENCLHPDDRASVNDYVNQVIAQRQSDFQLEFRILHPQYGIRWMLSLGQLTVNEQGEPIRLSGINLDISDHKQAEQKIREQAALLDIATNAIWVHDLDHRLVYWNQGAERLYGWTAKEALGQKANELLSVNAAEMAKNMQTVLEQGEWHGEIQKVTKTGKSVIVEGRWTLVRDEADRPKSILTVDTDITEKKSLEAQFYQAQRLESLGTLTSGIAHDLNNALTPILSIAQLLRMQQSGMDARSKKMLQVLEDSAIRGANMVQQILTFTRGTGGTRTLVDVTSLLQEVVKVTQQTFPKFIKIRAILPAQRVRLVSADATQLYQMLMNLCVNARDAMLNSGTLTLCVENFDANEMFAQMNLDARVGQYVVITVTDTGAGIAPEVRDRIFDPFFTTKALGQGTGLGLSTVLGIVRSYDGFVQVASEVGKGTQFKVYLPAIETEAAQKRQETKLHQGQGEWILVVDDEDHILQATRTILETYHYQVFTASSGAEAIAIYVQHKQDFAVVLVDMMMPDMDGIMLIQVLQKINPQVRVISVSGLLPQYQQNLEALGIKTRLNKPYTTEVLLNSIHLELLAEA